MSETTAFVLIIVVLCICFGDEPYGNREILFDRNGKEAGSGTLLKSVRPASWLREVTDENT